MPTSYKLNNDLYLVQREAPKKKVAKKVAVQVNHVVVIDCSGSMYWDLPQIREQLKRKVPKMLGQDDTLSIIWFSGRGQFGTLLEAEPVATLSDLQDINRAIDRWLRPVGLTGFKEPLEEADRLADRIQKKAKGSIFSLFMMSDGHDNTWNRSQILAVAEKLPLKYSSATFVEYGYYADRPLLARMAEKTGGCLIFAEDFDRYAPTFEGALQKKLSGAPRTELNISGDVVGGFAYALFDGDLLTFSVEAGKVLVPQDLPEIWYISPVPVGKGVVWEERGAPEHAVYAGISLFAQRMNSDVVTALLKESGDIRLIKQFSGCFGKQKYSEFVEEAQKATFDPKLRLVEGYDPDLVPPEDAFTVLELLQILAEDGRNRLLVDHPEFKYKRIGRALVDSNEVVTKTDQKAIADIAQRAATTKDPKELQKIAEELAEVSSKPSALKFQADSISEGYPISDLVFNESRPNVSLRVKKFGEVDLSSRLPENSTIPATFRTFVYRNYTIIRDGIVNVGVLPVTLTAETVAKLQEKDLPGDLLEVVGVSTGSTVLLNLRALPVINRKMIREVSAKTLFELNYELTKARAHQKVYNTVMKQTFPRESKSFADIYGDEAATWLKEQGITDFNGFNPKVVRAEASDFYTGKELKVSLKGLSSLPSMADVNKRRASGKLTTSASLMVPAIEKLEDFQNSEAYKEAPNQSDLLKTWLDGQMKRSRQQVRDLLFKISQATFSVVVGQIWFKEFGSLDENSLTIDVDNAKLACKVEMKEVQVEV
jgi:hypothetical protein